MNPDQEPQAMLLDREELSQKHECVVWLGEELRQKHEGQYRHPECVVFCKPGDPGGYPYANKQYRTVADTFAAYCGGEVTGWTLSYTFTISNGDKRYQVVSNRECIDVIMR